MHMMSFLYPDTKTETDKQIQVVYQQESDKLYTHEERFGSLKEEKSSTAADKKQPTFDHASEVSEIK